MSLRKAVTLFIAAVIGVVVLVSAFLRNRPETYDQKERAVHLEMIRRSSDSVAVLSFRILTITEKMRRDSLKHIAELKAKDEAYLKQKKHYEKIDLSRATAPELDSLRSGIRALYERGRQ